VLKESILAHLFDADVKLIRQILLIHSCARLHQAVNGHGCDKIRVDIILYHLLQEHELLPPVDGLRSDLASLLVEVHRLLKFS